MLNGKSNPRSDIINCFPHRAVFIINKPVKLRIAFDASAKHKGESLNK